MSERYNFRSKADWTDSARCDECTWRSEDEECREDARAHTMTTGHGTIFQRTETRQYTRYEMQPVVQTR